MSINLLQNKKKEIDMQKIYGYKEKDLFALAKAVKERGDRPLTYVFNEFSKSYGKAKGTVRNMYYALAKACKEKDYANKYLSGESLRVSKIKKFTSLEEKELVKKVVLGTANGKSVRKIINELSNGDMKTALRLQNKYRNIIKLNSKLYNECVNELIESGALEKDYATKRVAPKLKSGIYESLQKEIDGLIERIKSSLVSENQKLKNKISALESENLALKRQAFYNDLGEKNIIEFLKKEKENKVN